MNAGVGYTEKVAVIECSKAVRLQYVTVGTSGFSTNLNANLIFSIKNPKIARNKWILLSRGVWFLLVRNLVQA